MPHDSKPNSSNGITIYGDKNAIDILRPILMECADVCTNTDFVNVPEDEWMRRPMKDGWEDRLRKAPNDTQLVNGIGASSTRSSTASTEQA
ncbi:hypothetical protein IFM47457_05367 [Aspergillus lentulus]|nr:hypothetical protein IFM47457_05367 [Aspergillus lentulus]